MLEYDVAEQNTRLFAATGDKKVAGFDIPVKRKDLEALVASFRKPFENPVGGDGRFSGAFDAEAGAKLYDLLIKPAFSLPAVGGASRLVIVPDGALGSIPFEALVVSGLHFLGDSIDISYAQSATSLTLARTLRKPRASTAGVFILADPIFGRNDPRFGEDVPAASASEYATRVRSSVIKFMGVKGAKEDAVFQRLQQTGALAGNLERLFGQDVSILEGREAREARLRAEELSRYRYLVFATHGLLDDEVPYIREPALVLSQVGNADEDDGFLSMSEVMGLRLNADMVALTACKTGMGKFLGGEGVMGLGRAFQYAGAKNVLVSLWSVAEESTTLFTESFFKNLKAGKTPREALRLGRAEIRSKGYDHPFFWAPFILVGG